MMRSYFQYSGPIVSDEEDPESPEELTSETSPPDHPNDFDPMPKAFEYESDTSNESDDDIWEDDWPEEDQVEEDESRGEDEMIEPESQPRQKRRKLDVPVLKARAAARKNKRLILKSALVDIQKLIRSRRTNFEGGARGLQSYRAQAIESYLCLVVNGNQNGIPASETAAECLGFARAWGGRQVRRWVRIWTNNRDLPQSDRGCHVKVKSLLDDPMIKSELRTYVRSNKWAMNPQKLKDFANQKLLPAEAAKYCQEICDKEMPQGLKKYMEIELFPRIHMKVGKGISISTGFNGRVSNIQLTKRQFIMTGTTGQT
jgi:hypothetical protein